MLRSRWGPSGSRLWNYLEEMQAMDMPPPHPGRQTISLKGPSSPCRAEWAYVPRIPGRMFKALESLDFFVDTDLCHGRHGHVGGYRASGLFLL